MQDKIFTEVLCFSVLADQLRWRHILALKIGIISDGCCKILFPENAGMLPNIERSSIIRTEIVNLLVSLPVGWEELSGFFLRILKSFEVLIGCPWTQSPQLCILSFSEMLYAPFLKMSLL